MTPTPLSALDRPAPVTEIDTIIVGSGFGGLGMGIRLARSGESSFLILERGLDVGGTWRDNTYPGVACDIPSHLYSFSFRPKRDWSRFFAPGSEIQEYLRESAREEGLLPHLRFATEVLQMVWDDDAALWSLSTSRGDYRCRVLIIAAGRLSTSRLPAVPGLDTFPGSVFHSSNWDSEAALAGARIGVVGTGASSVQIIPELVGQAESVVVFQRSAPYIVPRDDRAFSEAELRTFERDPDAVDRLRSQLFWDLETGFAQRAGAPGHIDRLREKALGHLAAQVDDPALRATLTPDYEIGCKRVLLSNDFYPALNSPTVTLEASALASVEGSRVIAASGAEHELDVLILATGFQSTEPPFARVIVGRDGVTLADKWSTGMAAYASTTVHGFPNMFVIDGPNASLGHNSAVYMIEVQLDYILGALAHLAASGEQTLEVAAAAERAYVAALDERSASTVWINGGCRSWYVDERSDRLTLLWPGFAFEFREQAGRFDPAAYWPKHTPRRAVPARDAATPAALPAAVPAS